MMFCFAELFKKVINNAWKYIENLISLYARVYTVKI